jgi:UDP-N-acetylmuramoylalanine--D-glutamate ligase
MEAGRLDDLAGKRVTVVGLGIEGVDIARYLCRRGAEVTISDSKPAGKLGDRIRELEGLPVRLALGGGQAQEIEKAEALFVSQGVPLDMPALAAARARGVPLRSMMGLFLELCPGPIAGITGSSGKTTTTALLRQIFEADERPVVMGGNIGVGLLEQLPLIRPYTWSVLEISHSQLQLVKRSPHVAVITNIRPDHLDRFSWDDYRELKANLIRYQTTGDIAVLNYDDSECRVRRPLVRGELMWFSMGKDVPGSGVFVRDGWAVARCKKLEERFFPLAGLRLRGEHNQANALAAAAAAMASGIQPDAIAYAVATFRGVEHRLEFVGEADGVSYYNDSIATTPERTVAGLHSFKEPVVLLLGGRDKNLPLEGLVEAARRRCRAVILFGEAAPKLQQAFASQTKPPVRRFGTLDEAVAAARRTARPGDVVLLSPACTSYDAYDNFERRGEHFRSLVRPLAQEVQPSPK